MGPQPSKIQQQNSLSSQGSSKQIQQINTVLVSHERFHKVQFFMKTKEMKVELAVQANNILIQWSSASKALNLQEIKQYALLPKSWEYQKTALCGNVGVVKVVYDYFPFLLQKQIQTRSAIAKYFTQVQLMYLLYCLLLCAQKFHSNWKKIGDIRPKNIFKNQKGSIKIGNTFSWPMQLTNYQKAVFQKEVTYLAPQEIHDIRMGRVNPDSSRNAKQHIIQAQSFSIGLTLLHTGLLSDMTVLYSPDISLFKTEILVKKIQDWSKLLNYSNTIKDIVRGFCQQIPEKRLLCSELLPLLKPHEQKILSLTQFDKKILSNSIRQILQRKSTQSLVGQVWKACQGGLLQSFVLDRSKRQTQQSILGISQIKPLKTEQRMDSPQHKIKNISLGGSNLSKISSQKNNNKISNYEIGNRFANPTLTNQKFSPLKSKFEYPNNYKIQDSSYFTTPLGQSLYTFPNAGQSQFQASRLQSRFKPTQSNYDLLKQIQDQLEKSRKNFPK